MLKIKSCSDGKGGRDGRAEPRGRASNKRLKKKIGVGGEWGKLMKTSRRERRNPLDRDPSYTFWGKAV